MSTYELITSICRILSIIIELIKTCLSWLTFQSPIPFGLNLRPLQTRQEFVNKISLTFTCDFRRLRDIYRAIGSVESRYLNLEQT